jgi:hypothetical protein
MEFPISRQHLQNYRANEAIAAETKQRVSAEIQIICKGIEKIVLTSDERKYIYPIPRAVKFGELRPQNSSVSLVQQTGILRELLTAIVTHFPDSSVQMDPLDTYILIDWS